MAIFHFYSASCALLLLLTLSWRTATGLPVPAPATEQCGDCKGLFKDLLVNITELLKNDAFCHGSSSNNIEVSRAETVLACAPTLTQNSGCMMQRNSSFNEGECRSNIVKDLAYYAAAFQSYLNPELRHLGKELLRPTVNIIQSLRKNCSLMPNEEHDTSEEKAAQMWKDSTFNNRQEMCKMMRGFHVRTITISRAMGYMSSGDHKK